MASSAFMQISMAISSRSSDFLGSHSFTDNNRFRSRKVSLHGRKLGVCRCVSAQSAEETAYKTKVTRNSNMAKLQAGYLFPEHGVSTTTNLST
ncbi:LL-diaminopimelate aminotransferase, chloroplastic-like [Curcuma longa]|uniref:LL-diaminopimelate aminotransferase, chloroplastic-like n=1 Tax=Curcuma longa TaxID=136217 RepID=UPI003D9F469C